MTTKDDKQKEIKDAFDYFNKSIEDIKSQLLEIKANIDKRKNTKSD